MTVDSNGDLLNNNQVLDYWFQCDYLSKLNFHDFTQCIQLQKIKKPTREGIEICQYFCLKHPHQLCDSYELLLHTYPNLCELASNLLIPRVVGSSIPQTTPEKLYAKFMVAHFKPFSPTIPLLTHSETFEECFNSYHFTEFSRQIMSKNKNKGYVRCTCILQSQSGLIAQKVIFIFRELQQVFGCKLHMDMKGLCM